MRESYIPIRARKDMHYFSHITFAEFRYSVDAMGYAILVCCVAMNRRNTSGNEING